MPGAESKGCFFCHDCRGGATESPLSVGVLTPFANSPAKQVRQSVGELQGDKAVDPVVLLGGPGDRARARIFRL